MYPAFLSLSDCHVDCEKQYPLLYTLRILLSKECYTMRQLYKAEAANTVGKNNLMKMTRLRINVKFAWRVKGALRIKPQRKFPMLDEWIKTN